ncbi:hypothetical protein BGX33_009097 [Mortierella sp. NVP41]|nr:hypothetical protein BGX33_009097 [Mortierella sp. NVP41]
MNRRSHLTVGRQMSASRLAWLVQRTPNLAILSLKRQDCGFAPVIYQALANLPNLRVLHINIPSNMSTPAIPIEHMFPLFSRLDELHLAGSWYRHEKTIEPLSSSQKKAPWRLKSLRCVCQDWALTRFCPNLTSFEMTALKHPASTTTISLRFLLECPKLEKVELPSFTRRLDFVDVAETLRSLKALRSIFLNVHWREEIEFLCSPDMHTGEVQDMATTQLASTPLSSSLSVVAGARTGQDQDQKFSVPLLEHLHFGDVTADLSQQDYLAMVRNILKTRVKLKSFDAQNRLVQPAQLFAQPGEEDLHGWGCRNLETLKLNLPGSIYVKTEEEQIAFWRPVYRQIGLLPRLKSLVVKCPRLQKSVSCGILNLAGATSLRHLVLRDVDGAEWTREEVMDLLRVVPNLETLILNPLQKHNYLQVETWLREAGRADIVFGEHWTR